MAFVVVENEKKTGMMCMDMDGLEDDTFMLFICSSAIFSSGHYLVIHFILFCFILSSTANIL